ncbi:MAG: hypothetical protein ACR2MA_06460 [Egibacteraceae bacterium]
MSDFEAELARRLSRNEELAEERAAAEEQMDRVVAEQAEARARAAREREQAQREQHSQLASFLRERAEQLKQAAPDTFVLRMGWTESGEEFIVKLSTRTLSPSRSLFIELDRDDDEVLVRWHSDVGNSLELWQLLEASTDLLGTLLLQFADQETWRGAERPPAFPTG